MTNDNFTVSITRNGLTLNSYPFYLLGGQLHYFRYPRAEWRNLLKQALDAGLNTIDTVIPWNLHEPQPGQFNFSDLADLPAYLDLCAELGLYVIARPGPYICAEWENGGLPAWLSKTPGIVYRTDNPAYLQPTLRWFDTLIPMLAQRQRDHGGAIILVQIENEHWGSGVYGHDAHQQTLATAMRQRGITVPLYTCMGAGNNWPEFRNGWNGIAGKLAETRATWPHNPLIVSELWSGWFDNWGSSTHTGKTAAGLDMRLHELTAAGTAGFSHWMWSGGTNFAWWGGRTVGSDTIHNTASYDYHAPISEYGGLTDKYFVARRHHLFLASFGTTIAPLLADAQPGGATVITTDHDHLLSNVHHGLFTATFFKNSTPERQTHQFFAPEIHLSIPVEANTIKPIFTHLPLPNTDLTLLHHTGRLLGLWLVGGRDLLIIYGFPGELGQLAVQSNAAWQITNADTTTCHINHTTLTVNYCLTHRPTVVQAQGSRPFTLILLTQPMAERCRPVDKLGFVIGPHALYHHPITDGLLTLEIDRRGELPAYFIAANGTCRELPITPASESVAPPVLSEWEVISVQELTGQTGWHPIPQPQPFESLGCYWGYGWYRVPQGQFNTDSITLVAPGINDRARLFVDGVAAGTLGVNPNGKPTLTLPLTLTPELHDIRLLVDNLGRFNYGSQVGEAKGLTDTLYLAGSQQNITEGWQALWQETAFAGEAIANARPGCFRPDATDVDLASFPFSGRDLWLLREIDVPQGHRAILYFTGDRNPGALYVNGKTVVRFNRNNGGCFLKHDITDYLNQSGNTIIALHLTDYAGLAWHGWLITVDPTQPLPGDWQFTAGVTPASTATSLPAGQSAAGPCFLRSRFAFNPHQPHQPPLKLSLYGLHKGQVWLNGRNLCRYWQIGPQEFYKIPLSWLAEENELLIFEEEGGTPVEVKLYADSLGSCQPVTVNIPITAVNNPE